MPVRRDNKGRWRYREMVRFPNGTSKRISGSAPRHRNSKVAAEAAKLEHIDRLLHPERYPKPRKEVPTFAEWFEGRFWREWVVARKNKPSEVESKQSIFKIHLKKAFGEMYLDEVDVGAIARFRADLVEAGKADKTINNILAVLSKALKYAEDVGLVDKAPKVGLLRAERPEIVCWSLDEYARMLQAARELDPSWHVAACLAGEAGLRIGEVRALEWRRDVDLVAGTITVKAQTRRGKTGTPKGRTRRTIPMTPTLLAALKGLDQIRTGFAVRNLDGSAKTDDQTKYQCHAS